MPHLGWPEILVIAFLILLLFGAKKIPELMRNLGSGMKEFKKSISSEENNDKNVGNNIVTKNESNDVGLK
jgi:sec-independent protein translocase protein TatA